MRERWKRTAEALAYAGARVTERAFNCKRDRVAALQRTHKMLWFALSAYLEPNKKRYKSTAYQGFNIIAVIRLAFSHARIVARRTMFVCWVISRLRKRTRLFLWR